MHSFTVNCGNLTRNICLKTDSMEYLVVGVGSPHQSPRCGVSRFRSAQSIAIPLSVVSFDIAGTLKRKVGVVLPASAAPPPKRRFDE